MAEVLRDMAPRVVAFEIFFDGSRPGDDELAGRCAAWAPW